MLPAVKRRDARRKRKQRSIPWRQQRRNAATMRIQRTGSSRQISPKEQAEEAEDGEGRGSLFLPWVVLEDWFTNAFGLDGWCSFVCSRKDTWRFNILARDGGIQGT